jgi:hypothetical protein
MGLLAAKDKMGFWGAYRAEEVMYRMHHNAIQKGNLPEQKKEDVNNSGNGREHHSFNFAFSILLNRFSSIGGGLCHIPGVGGREIGEEHRKGRGGVRWSVVFRILLYTSMGP